MKWIVFMVLLTIALSTLPQDDQVTANIPDYHFYPIYSGYLEISALEDHKIHYVYFTSQKDKAKDPLVIWLHGGPGCSGLNAAFLQNGPFTIKPLQHSFTINQHAWNKRANLVYLQVPGQVGFSDNGNIQTYNDQLTTQQAIYALRLFFTKFPSLKKSEIYLTGSGYGAVFATHIAKAMIEENKDPFSIFYDKFNIKGVLMGNPCVSPEECYASGSEKQSFYHYQFLYKRAYYPKTVYNNFLGNCVLGYDDVDCYRTRKDMDKDFNKTQTSTYNIYSKCYRTGNQSNSINTGCLDEKGIIDYLNDPNVKEDWNVDKEKKWQPCNKQVWNEYIPGNNSYEHIPYLIKNHIRLWVYSGDLDASVPIIGTKNWIERLKAEELIPIKRIWREWWVPGRHTGEDQVGGNVWELQTLTFASVKGAGFRAAFDQPMAMEQILNGFLDDKSLPEKQF